MTQKSIERREGWFRILVFIVTGIILAVWRYLIFLLVIVNFLITIVSGKRNKELAEFSEYWNTELYRFVRYITFVSNERPFPFVSMKRLTKFQRN